MPRIVFFAILITAACFAIEARHHHTSKGRNDADTLLKVDACPHVLVGSSTAHKMDQLNLHGVTRMCCLGNPGEKIVGLCKKGDPSSTIYESCSSNTYIDKYKHKQTSCLPQIEHCSDDRDLAVGNSTTPSRCLCKDGYHEILNRRCVPHTKCTGKKRVKHKGTPFRDAVCETQESVNRENEALAPEMVENITVNIKQQTHEKICDEPVAEGSTATTIILTVIATIAFFAICYLVKTAVRHMLYIWNQRRQSNGSGIDLQSDSNSDLMVSASDDN